MPLVTIIGRGHSGTRAMSHTLYTSGVYMGRTINTSGDKVPPHDLYDACRIFAKYVKWTGGLSWDFSRVMKMDVDPEFEEKVETYLADVMAYESPYRGWKLPETTLIYPWIVRLYPEIRYIHWIRDPRDGILAPHRTDDLRQFGIAYPATEDTRRQRAISWLYQYQLMKATPRPANLLTVRFEDFVMDQEETLRRLEGFLGIPLSRIVVRPEAVGRWKKAEGDFPLDLLREALVETGYEV